MEGSSEDNLTTRSLLKGILATEPVRTAVKHQSKTRVNQRPSTSYVHQDENSSSPSMNLRSKMRDRVRRSLGKSALEASILKRNVETNSKTKPKSTKKGSHPIMEDLDKITPRTLLKRIIQNEDEVSIIVSQKSKAAAADDKKQENTPTAKLSSVGNVNLSLPDVQDTEHITMFRKSTKKRKMRVSEFEREVDERLPKSKGNYNISHDGFDVSSSLVNSYTISGSVENKLEISAAPESTFKRRLLRRPNKICLVSLGDFEQGVEYKYQQLKGSQECFIEPTEEDGSDILLNEVAQMNTELYAQSLHKETNTPKSDRKQRGTSKLFVSTYDEMKEANDELLETETRKLNANNQPTFNAQSPEENTNKDIEGESGEVIDDSDEEGGNNDQVDSEAAADSGEGETADVHVEDEVGDHLKDVERNVQKNKSSLSNSKRKSTGVDEYSHMVQHARLSDGNVTQTDESVHVHAISVSRPEESYESSESSNEESLDLAQSAIDRGMAKKKENNLLMLSALPETTNYFKFARFASTDKPATSKKIQRTRRTMPKKQKSVFTSSQVKQIFNHHAQVRVSKEALADVEKCLDLYVNQLAIDLSTYTAHANRKTIMCADMELLMKRQRLVTDTTSLNVLIEKHLPLECRKLLIPCATSGNKVFPKM